MFGWTSHFSFRDCNSEWACFSSTHNNGHKDVKMAFCLKNLIFLLYSHDWLKPNWMVNFDFPHNSSDLISKIQLPKNPKSKNITAAVTFFFGLLICINFLFFNLYKSQIYCNFRNFSGLWSILNAKILLNEILTNHFKVWKKPWTKNLLVA